MTDTGPYPRRNQAAALVAGSVAAVVLAMGFSAIAFARGTTAERRPPAVTGRIPLKLGEIYSGGTVRSEVVFVKRTPP
jgi:hypothetical protein